MNVREPPRRWEATPAFRPEEHQVRDLIGRARRHELGLAFLLDGAQDAVAATFGVHAFVVDAARDQLRTPGVR